MAAAAKKLSQVGTHMAIAFVIAYSVTGSIVFGGLAIIVEPVINVVLLPFHEKMWARARLDRGAAHGGLALLAGEKVSQASLHAGVAFAVMYAATGSAVLGGVAAILEPVCNVILLPLHDRAWDALGTRQFAAV
ncbi:DUF2061 domain-containing protein [Telluria aromaticivorans]|uniref:DUF2061 domain-containing protein n=1 Tax=Telluria aromaticivorans TaxID=2725995 RepID=A0A7Y2K397_9BURK|nr:DUF2061 domain-containing protein [Telluria aromaticivorans]NNG25865.1 DUF2061 domain-containing protein [Telluria aromaticivorans]